MDSAESACPWVAWSSSRWRPSDLSLFQNLIHDGLEGFGLCPRLSRFNLLARQLRFQFVAQMGGAVPGILNAGGVIQDDQQQLEGVLHITSFRLQPREADNRFQRYERPSSFGCDVQ